MWRRYAEVRGVLLLALKSREMGIGFLRCSCTLSSYLERGGNGCVVVGGALPLLWLVASSLAVSITAAEI
jgi:hypothetical protein